MNQLSNKILVLMDMIAHTNIHTGNAPVIPTMKSGTITAVALSSETLNQTSLSMDSSDRHLDCVFFSSPRKKKYRAGSKRNDSEDSCDMDEAEIIHELDDCHTFSSGTNVASTAEIPTTNKHDSLRPLFQAVCTPLPDDNCMEPQSELNTREDVTTDLQSRYHNHSSHGGEHVP
jgi:hypothetical protein